MPAGGPHDEYSTQMTPNIIREPAGPPMSTDTLRQILKRCLLVAVACLSTSPAIAQRGAMTLPRNLEQMVVSAADIVRGTVLDARVEKHPGARRISTRSS